MDQRNRTTGRTAVTTRQARHALTALAALTPGRRRVVQAAAENYLSQIDRRHLPVGYTQPINDDRINRADAYHMRRGETFARMLGIACQPADANLPDTARAVLAAINAPVDELTNKATSTGQPFAVALLHIFSADSGQADEAPRRVQGRPAPIAKPRPQAVAA